VAGVGVAALSLLPAPHHATTRANGWTSIGNARLSNLHGRDVAGAALALAEAERALAESPGFVRAELLAARACLPLGRLAEAQRHVDAVLAAEPDYPQALVQLALIKAIDVPDNPHRDVAGARALLERLRPMVARDPSIAQGVALLEQMLR